MKKNNGVAHRKPSDFSLGQVYEFCVEFGRQGGSSDLLQQLIEKKKRMARVVAIARGDAPKVYEPVTTILGFNFISPGELAEICSWSYSDDQLQHFAETIPDKETLGWLCANGYMLLATPPDNDFVVGCEWLAIRWAEVPGSFRKTWGEQQDLLTEVERVPNKDEVEYALTIYRRVRGACHLLPGKSVRTSSISTDGNHFVVEYLDDLFYISDRCDESCWDNVGIASALNLK